MKKKVEKIVEVDKIFCDACGLEVSDKSKWLFESEGKHFCSDDCAKQILGLFLKSKKKAKQDLSTTLENNITTINGDLKVVDPVKEVEKDKTNLYFIMLFSGILIIIVCLVAYWRLL